MIVPVIVKLQGTEVVFLSVPEDVVPWHVVPVVVQVAWVADPYVPECDTARG